MGMFGELNKLNKAAAQPRSNTPKAKDAPTRHAPVGAKKPASPIHRRTDEPSNEATNVAMSKPIATPYHEANDGRNEETNVPTNQRTFLRKKIRHTFDIYDDQLLSLREIALERQKIFGERVLLGDLVQEALDMFISKERNKG
jgi:hypothetical protein